MAVHWVPAFPTAPPLVGRGREQAALRGSLMLVGGEAGVGKTALAEWLLDAARQQGAAVLIGRCYDPTETPP